MQFSKIFALTATVAVAVASPVARSDHSHGGDGDVTVVNNEQNCNIEQGMVGSVSCCEDVAGAGSGMASGGLLSLIPVGLGIGLGCVNVPIGGCKNQQQAFCCNFRNNANQNAVQNGLINANVPINIPICGVSVL